MQQQEENPQQQQVCCSPSSLPLASLSPEEAKEFLGTLLTGDDDPGEVFPVDSVFGSQLDPDGNIPRLASMPYPQPVSVIP